MSEGKKRLEDSFSKILNSTFKDIESQDKLNKSKLPKEDEFTISEEHTQDIDEIVVSNLMKDELFSACYTDYKNLIDSYTKECFDMMFEIGKLSEKLEVSASLAQKITDANKKNDFDFAISRFQTMLEDCKFACKAYEEAIRDGTIEYGMYVQIIATSVSQFVKLGKLVPETADLIKNRMILNYCKNMYDFKTSFENFKTLGDKIGFAKEQLTKIKQTIESLNGASVNKEKSKAAVDVRKNKSDLLGLKQSASSSSIKQKNGLRKAKPIPNMGTEKDGLTLVKEFLEKRRIQATTKLNSSENPKDKN